MIARRNVHSELALRAEEVDAAAVELAASRSSVLTCLPSIQNAMCTGSTAIRAAAFQRDPDHVLAVRREPHAWCAARSAWRDRSRRIRSRAWAEA